MMREKLCRRHDMMGEIVTRWPVYLSITFPADSPPPWKGIVGSRLMTVLLPQLQGCGFFPRPLCVDEPSYLLLLWPLESMWTHYAKEDIILPLQDRVLPCLFAMLETAHSNLWSYNARVAPPLTCLLPELDVMLCDL